MKTDYSLEVGCKADLTSKMEIEMPVLSLVEVEFDRFPYFLGNKRASGMEIGSFGVVSQLFVEKLFARNAAFRGMQRQCAERIMKTDYSLEVGCKADLTSKVEIGNEVFLPFRQD